MSAKSVHTDIDHFILYERILPDIYGMWPEAKSIYMLGVGDSDTELLNFCGPEPLRILL